MRMEVPNMKGRKLLALALALALCLALAAPVLAAEPTTHESFADLMVIDPITGDYQWKWAFGTIDDAIRRGLFIGYSPYQDAQGNIITNFGPGDSVTEAVGLTLCARMMVDNDTRELILADRLEQMRTLIPGTSTNPDDPAAPFMWFREEAATCLELGIIEAKDLELLIDADRLGATMTKADFAVYLVRAMGLEDFAKGLDATELPFNDEAKIKREYRPYVKLLSTYGVLTGDEGRNFNPDASMNRAVCATMLSRAIENIQEERQVAVELPRYTTYSWVEGYIQNVNVDTQGVRTLTLKSDITGTQSVALPSSVSIYQYNMPAKATDLKNGAFAKVCFNTAGQAVAVRLTPAGFLSSIQGSCDAVTRDSVTVDGVTYSIDRFTEVSAGGKTGEHTIIDLDAGYTDAKLVANSKKVVVSLELTGGTRLVEGVLTDLTSVNQGASTKTTMVVNAFNGLPTNYDVPAQLTVTAGGQTLTGLKESFEGRHVTLRVADDDLSRLKSVDVDIDSQYIQGVLQSVNTKTTPVKAEITRLGDAKRTPYEVDEECVVLYEGNATELGKLPTGTFVTAKVDGGMLTLLSAWTGLESAEGTLSGLTYGDPTVLVVTGEDGAKSEFSIPLADLKNVTILVNGEDADITKLGTGDSVVITLRYHDVTQIDVTPRSADVTGVLDSVTFKSDGSAVLSVRSADGTNHDYTAASSVTVTREGKPVALTEVINARGQQVSLVTEGDRTVSIQFSGTAVSQDMLEGVILNKDDQARIATILVSGNGTSAKPVNVHIPSGTTLTDARGTILSNITRLSPGDTIQVYGSYSTDGTFEAKLVIRK